MKPEQSITSGKRSIFRKQIWDAGIMLVILLLMAFWLVSCGPAGSDQVPVAELPDPAIYALNLSELPEVGMSWQQTYNQTTSEQGYKWSYLAYQAYQPGSLGADLESGFAVNNDVYLYEVNISHEDLPQPPQSIGSLQNISWKSVSQTQRLGDKSALWKTNIGEMLTPAWRLEFYQGHAYVCISMFGFPDQFAPAIINQLGDILAARLPHSVDTLRSDAATRVPTRPVPLASATAQSTLAAPAGPPTEIPQLPSAQNYIIPNSYTAPPGETGMVSYFDDTGKQLTDDILGTDDILADQGSGTAYEWVGWTEATNPITLTFTFTGEVNISGVKIGINRRDGLGIFSPSVVSINGQRYDLAADVVANNQRKDLVFTGAFSGPNLQIVLFHRGRGWILLDEVRFIQGK